MTNATSHNYNHVITVAKTLKTLMLQLKSRQIFKTLLAIYDGVHFQGIIEQKHAIELLQESLGT